MLLFVDVSDVIFDTQLFFNGLNKIQKANIIKYKGLGGLTYISGLCFVCSDWSIEKITSLLGIDKQKISSSIEKLRHYNVHKWITNPFMEKDDIKEELNVLKNEIRYLKKRLALYTISAFIFGFIIGLIL